MTYGHLCDSDDYADAQASHADDAPNPGGNGGAPKRQKPKPLEHWISPEPNTGCWIWTGGIDRYGYGQTTARGKTEGAHRASYETYVGPIPDGLQIDHLCRVRSCVNPDHLEAVTCAENVRRAREVVWKTKPLCARGHDDWVWFDGPSGGHRKCKTCQRKHNTEWVRANRAAKRVAA